MIFNTYLFFNIIIQLCYNQNIPTINELPVCTSLEVDGGEVGEGLHGGPGAAPPALLQPRPRLPPPPQGLCTPRVVTCHVSPRASHLWAARRTAAADT